MWLDKKAQKEVELPKQIEFAFNILNYNQGLIQFADSKANALLLINSIFIASICPFIELFKKGGPLITGLVVVFFVASIVSILLALGVITARQVSDIEATNRTLVFYGHITENNSPEGYIHEFGSSEIKKFRESLLVNVYVLAKIASNKFKIYGVSQGLTMFSSILWIMCMVLIPFL